MYYHRFLTAEDTKLILVIYRSHLPKTFTEPYFTSDFYYCHPYKYLVGAAPFSHICGMLLYPVYSYVTLAMDTGSIELPKVSYELTVFLLN